MTEGGSESSSIPFRNYVRKMLRERKEPSIFVGGVVQFADAIFYGYHGVGSLDHHLSRARKYGQKAGLSDDDLERAHETAKKLLIDYESASRLIQRRSPSST